jgi:peptide/nickel transport system permease protein
VAIESEINAAEIIVASPRVSEWHRFVGMFLGRWLVKLGLVLVLLCIIMAVFAPLIAPFDPNAQNRGERLQQPSQEHLLGTDSLGRDTFSRIIYGTRVSLMVAIGALFIGSSVGVILGLIAGYYGRWVFTIIMRCIDALQSFPSILTALVVAGLLGGGILNIVLAIGVGLISSFCRLMCGQVLSVKEQDYITAAHSIGSKNFKIMFSHILPNSFPPLIVQITLWMGHAILAEAGLSFLGVGIRPPTASLGSMINDGYKYLLTNPVLSLAPGAAVMLIVFGFNMVGDGLRDALDPRLRGKL